MNYISNHELAEFYTERGYQECDGTATFMSPGNFIHTKNVLLGVSKDGELESVLIFVEKSDFKNVPPVSKIKVVADVVVDGVNQRYVVYHTRKEGDFLPIHEIPFFMTTEDDIFSIFTADHAVIEILLNPDPYSCITN